jgi:hypothetical protein
MMEEREGIKPLIAVCLFGKRIQMKRKARQKKCRKSSAKLFQSIHTER